MKGYRSWARVSHLTFKIGYSYKLHKNSNIEMNLNRICKQIGIYILEGRGMKENHGEILYDL